MVGGDGEIVIDVALASGTMGQCILSLRWKRQEEQVF